MKVSSGRMNLCSGMKLLWCSLLCVLFFSRQVYSNQVWQPSIDDLRDWLGIQPPKVFDGESFSEFRRLVLNRINEFAHSYLQRSTEQPKSKAYPYFSFIPPYVSSTIPGKPVSWENSCFKTNTAKLNVNSNGTYTLTITVKDQQGLFCSDMYLFATITGVSLQTYSKVGTYSLLWSFPSDVKQSEIWDLQTKGVRVFRFLDNMVQTIDDILTTASLFEPLTTVGVDQKSAAVNIDFFSKYAGFQMYSRNTTEIILNETEIHSGDFLGITRLDGLDPMLAWAMGSSTGHTAVALWFDNELYICESTTKDSYWPTNGIQRTPYRLWLSQAKAAGHNVVFAPLRSELREAFNETAAVQFFLSVEGLDYGFPAQFFGWIDTIADNFPCLPPDYTQCLQFEHIEVIIGLVDRFIPSIGDQFFNEGLNFRLKTTGLKAADILYEAYKQGIAANSLFKIVEQDSWNYHIQKYGNETVVGKAMICCVFVCNIWKTGGIFKHLGIDDDEVNCGEFVDWDTFGLNLFDTNRPAGCTGTDPANPLCQIEGEYTLVLNDFNTKTPIPHMAEQCPSLAPKYYRPSGC